MNKIHHVIYAPGLGDRPGNIQIKLINKWRRPGLEPHYFAVGWSNDEPFELKLKRLTDLIDQLSTKTSRVSLFGTSAGAGMVLNGYLARPAKVSKVVYVCGELTGYANINPRYFKENPAFKDSMVMADAGLAKLTGKDKAKMLSIQPFFDDIVPIKETKIPGVKNKTVFSIFHVPTIGLSLTLYKRIVINFLNNGVK